MRVELKTDGGFAYMPGLNKPLILDDDTLSKSQADALRRLIDAAHFYQMPAVVNKPKPGAADHRSYTLTIQDGGQQHTVQAVDPVTDAGLKALMDYIRETAQ